MFSKYAIIKRIIKESENEQAVRHLEQLSDFLKEEDKAVHSEIDELREELERTKFKMEEKYQLIANIKHTLNGITLSGASNMSALLGSIQALDRLAEMLEKEDAEKSAEVAPNDSSNNE